MNAPLTETALSYGGPPPLLIAATSQQALRRAQDTAGSSSMRIGAELAIAEAPERLRQQASASAIWIEVDRDCGPELERLLDEVDDGLETRRFGAVLSVTAEMIDILGERLFRTGAQIVVDGDPLDVSTLDPRNSAVYRDGEQVV